MYRLALVVSILGCFTGTVLAQPAPPAPQPGQPAEPPVPTPSAPIPPAPVPAEPPAPVAPPVVEVKVVEKVVAPALPKKLAVGAEGVFQPGALLQGWFFVDTKADGDTQHTVSSFRLRRAEISAKGEIVPKLVGYALMFDPAKVREPVDTKIDVLDAAGMPTGNTVIVKQQPKGTASSVLQDFFITGLSKYADVSIGQFKIPVSWEGYNSSAKIVFPERAPISVAFGDKRDLGIRIAKTFEKFGYSFGVFNGQGQNNLDTNNQKDVALRLEVYPVKGMTIAGVAYDSVGYRERAGTKDRWEGDLRYESGRFLFQSEYIRARDVAKNLGPATTGQGFYALLGYTLKDPTLHGDLQPVVRFGYFDPDANSDVVPKTETDPDELTTIDAGVNYYLKGQEMKLQLDYQRQMYDQRHSVNSVIFAAQVWY